MIELLRMLFSWQPERHWKNLSKCLNFYSETKPRRSLELLELYVRPQIGFRMDNAGLRQDSKLWTKFKLDLHGLRCTKGEESPWKVSVRNR